MASSARKLVVKEAATTPDPVEVTDGQMVVVAGVATTVAAAGVAPAGITIRRIPLGVRDLPG